MIQEKKQEEYNLMENSPKRMLTVQIKNGPMLKVNNCWDFAKNFPNISEKSLLNNGSPVYDRLILQKVLYER